MKTAKIVDVAEQIRGVSYNPEDAFDTEKENTVPLLRANNIQDAGLNYDDLVYVLKNKVSPKQLLQQGDILVCASSGSRHLVGKAGQVYNDFGTFGAFCKVLRPNIQLVNSNYFAHYFQSPLYRRTIADLAAGANINNIKNEHLNELQIKLPCLQEQNTIAKILDKANTIIGSRKAQLSCLNELAKSRFIEMFGNTVLNPFGWEKELLGSVCDVRDGTHDSPEYHETGYPLVTSKNVVSGKIDLTNCALISEADFKKINARSKVDIGDIIMPMIGTVGNPVIVTIEPSFAIKNVALIKFKPATKVLNNYVQTLLQSDYFDAAVLGKIRGGTQKFISLGDIRRLEILVPPLSLQNEFASFIEQLDKSKFTIRKSLEKLETLYRALLQEYFG